MICAYLLAVVSLLVAGTEAASVRNYHDILARQTQPLNPNAFPPQCQSICTPAVNALNTCTSATCLCTNGNGASLQGCMDCFVAAAPGTVAQARTVLNDYNMECVAASINVTPLSLSVGSSTSTSSTTPSTSTSPATRSSSTPSRTSTVPIPRSTTTTSTSRTTGTSSTTTPFSSSTSSSASATSTTTGSGSSGSPSSKNAAVGGRKGLGDVWGTVAGVLVVGLASFVMIVL